LKRCDESCAAQPLRAPQPHEGGDYGGGDNPNRAVSFVEELLDRCLGLADTPRAYSLVPRYERFGIRRCVHGDYLIFDRLQPEQIEVIHVLQGRMDLHFLFSPKSAICLASSSIAAWIQVARLQTGKAAPSFA
jgi:plasmid stabilization system protein ParE